MPLSYEAASSYTPCPPNTYPAICVQAIELGVQPGYQGGPDKAQIYIGFEMAGTERDDGQPYLLGKRYTVTLFDQGSLYPLVDTLLGAVPQASKFNPKNLLGKSCLAEVKNKARADGGTTAVIESVVSLPHGMDEPKASSILLFYDWNNKDPLVYDQLPEWLRKVIDQGKDQPQPKLAVIKTVPEFDDDIPL